MKQTTSFWEKLKICYRVLTLDYYVYFGFNKNAILWEDDGRYKGLDRKGFSAFEYLDDQLNIEAYGKVTSLHDLFWHIIEKWAIKQQSV